MAALSKFLFSAGLLFLVAGVAITILPGGFSPSSADSAGPDTPVRGQQEGANGQTATETSAPDTATATEQAPSTTGDSAEAYRPQTDQEQAGEIRDDDESDADDEEEKKGEEDEKGEEGEPRAGLLLLMCGGWASRW